MTAATYLVHSQNWLCKRFLINEFTIYWQGWSIWINTSTQKLTSRL